MREAFDAIAGDYARFDESRVQKLIRAGVDALLEKYLAPGATILDAGSGPGSFALPLARRGFRVTAVDIAPRMLEELSLRAQNEQLSIETICTDLLSPHLPLPRADAVLAISGPLSYVEDPLPLARALIALANPGGLLIFVFARAAGIEQLLRNPRLGLTPFITGRAASSMNRFGGDSFPLYVHDPRALRRTFAEELELVEQRGIALSRYLPPAVDRYLGIQRGLRRFGAATLLAGRTRAKL